LFDFQSVVSGILNSPGIHWVQAVLALLSLQRVPIMNQNTGDQSKKRQLKVLSYLTSCDYTEVLTAGPEGPADPVSPSFPERPCSERSISFMKSDPEIENDESIWEDLIEGKVIMVKMYSLSVQDDQQDPSLLSFQLHPDEEKSRLINCLFILECCKVNNMGRSTGDLAIDVLLLLLCSY